MVTKKRPEKKIQKEIRVVYGMTQRDFCKKEKISVSTVSGWANNRRPIAAKHINILKDRGFSEDSIRDPGGIA